jgi:hypothetical protein
VPATYTPRDAYDIGQRLGQANPGVPYDDLAVTESSNREAWELVNYIDEEELDYLAVDLEKGWSDARRLQPRYDPPED